MKPILEIQNISKRFAIRHTLGSYLSLREQIRNAFMFRRDPVENFWALRDISFEVERGLSLGIIGRNGAGKSTLLKILSRITVPTKGRVICRGRIASLLEVGTGFHMELTGRENIYFNGSLLGMKRREIRAKFDDIVDFSGTEKFLDTQLKHYSSGMQLRLAFSVAAFLEPEILVVDEVLAVGDAEFQKKCIGKMDEVRKSGRTMLFVSHDLGAVSNLCKQVAVLKDGALQFFGDTWNGITYYQRDFKTSGTYVRDNARTKRFVFFQEINVCDPLGKNRVSFAYDEPVMIDFHITIRDPSLKWDLLVLILDARKRRVFALESSNRKSRMQVIIEPETLVRGDYSISAIINQPNIVRLDEVDDVCNFEIVDNGSQMLKHGSFDYGNVFGRGKWI